jgi:hypothetical protein
MHPALWPKQQLLNVKLVFKQEMGTLRFAFAGAKVN